MGCSRAINRQPSLGQALGVRRLFTPLHFLLQLHRRYYILLGRSALTLIESIGGQIGKLRVFSRRTSLTKTAYALELTHRAEHHLVFALPRLWSRQGVQESA